MKKRSGTTAEKMGIKKVTKIHKKTVAVPIGGLARTRVITKKISLPRVTILDGPSGPPDEKK